MTARNAFAFGLSLFFLAVALTGFSTTFFFPLARGTFSALAVVFVHGGLLFSWLLLFIAQTSLVRAGQVGLHRALGWVGVALVAGIVSSGVVVGAWATRRDLQSGETWPWGAYVNIVIELVLFATLVGAAVLTRRAPDRHRRFLFLATISVLGPAWFRFRHFMPFVPNPLVSFSFVADSVLLAVVVHDWRTLRRVHPVTAIAGGAMFLVHLVELGGADTAAWERLGRWLLELF